MVQAIKDQDTVNRNTARFCSTLWTTSLTTFSLRLKQIFIIMAMSIQFSKLSLLGNREPSRYSPQTFTFWKGYCLVWCSIFWDDRQLFLWTRGRHGSNSKFSPLHWDASHISGTRVAETWCLNPDSLVSARRDNGSLRELECEFSTRRCQLAWPHEEGILNGLQDRPISTPVTSSSGDINSKVYDKKPRTTVDLKQNIRDEVAAISPTTLKPVMQNFQKRLREYLRQDDEEHVSLPRQGTERMKAPFTKHLTETVTCIT